MNAGNWRGRSWHWIGLAGGRSSFRDRSWRRVCSSRWAVLFLVGQIQSFLLLSCNFLCCPSILSRSEKSAVITKQTEIKFVTQTQFYSRKILFRTRSDPSHQIQGLKNVNYEYFHYRILIYIFLCWFSHSFADWWAWSGVLTFCYKF